MTLEKFKQLIAMLLNVGMESETKFIQIMLMAQQTIKTKIELLMTRLEDSQMEFGMFPSFSVDEKGDRFANQYSERREVLNLLAKQQDTNNRDFSLIEEEFKAILHRLLEEVQAGNKTGVDNMERGRLATDFAEIGTKIDSDLDRLEELITDLERLRAEASSAPREESVSYTSTYLDLLH